MRTSDTRPAEDAILENICLIFHIPSLKPILIMRRNEPNVTHDANMCIHNCVHRYTHNKYIYGKHPGNTQKMTYRDVEEKRRGNVSCCRRGVRRVAHHRCVATNERRGVPPLELRSSSRDYALGDILTRRRGMLRFVARD